MFCNHVSIDYDKVLVYIQQYVYLSNSQSNSMNFQVLFTVARKFTEEGKGKVSHPAK